MNKFIFGLLGLMMASQVNAAQLSTCLEKVQQGCLNDGRTYNELLYRFQRGAECKVVQAGTRESDGTRYNEKIVFFDGNSVVSTELLANSLFCRTSASDINGRINDTAAMDGRIFMAVQDYSGKGRLLAVDRINRLVEVLNSKGKSYSSIVGVKIDQGNDQLILQRKGNQTTELNLSQLLKHLNSNDGTRCIDGCNNQ